MARPIKELPLRTQKGILNLKEEGLSNADIAAAFGVSERTILRRIKKSGWTK